MKLLTLTVVVHSLSKLDIANDKLLDQTKQILLREAGIKQKVTLKDELE